MAILDDMEANLEEGVVILDDLEANLEEGLSFWMIWRSIWRKGCHSG